MKFKTTFVTTLSLMIYNLSYSWGLDLRRSFEVWGLPDTEDVLESTIIGMLIIAVGFLITYIGNKLDIEFIGLLGLGVMFLGFFFLFPLLTWLEFLFVNAYILFYITIGVAIVLILIYSVVLKK